MNKYCLSQHRYSPQNVNLPIQHRHSRKSRNLLSQHRRSRESGNPKGTKDETTPRRLHTCEQIQGNLVHWCHQRSGSARMAAQKRSSRRLYQKVPSAYSGVLRIARRYDRGDYSRKATQKMESCLEDGIDRKTKSPLAGFMGRHQRLKYHPSVMDCRSRMSHYRRSRENGNPASALWIPACAGMTARTFLAELGYE
jgi:hypothetical protein